MSRMGTICHHARAAGAPRSPAYDRFARGNAAPVPSIAGRFNDMTREPVRPNRAPNDRDWRLIHRFRVESTPQLTTSHSVTANMQVLLATPEEQNAVCDTPRSKTYSAISTNGALT